MNRPLLRAILVLPGTALAFASWPLAAWTATFFVVNALYFPLSDEKGLEKRFGEDYRLYRDNMPRRVPRLRPWQGP